MIYFYFLLLAFTVSFLKSEKALFVHQNSKINLQPDEGFLIGIDTPVWIAEGDDKTKELKYILQNGVMQTVNNHFYKNKEILSSISNFVNLQTSKINSPDLFRIVMSTNQRERRATESELSPDIETSNRIDALIAELFGTGTQGYIRTDLGKSDIVYPELLIFVSDSWFRRFHYKVEKAVTYLIAFWNGVNLLYEQMDNPKVRLNIVGIVLFKNYKVGTGMAFHDFRRFITNEDKFKFQEDYDIAVYMTENFKQDHTLGQAGGHGTACHSDGRYGETEIFSYFMVFDDLMFSGVKTAAHELGHLFAAHHEEENSFIMRGAHNVTLNQALFSNESLKEMSNFLRENEADCLRNNPAERRTDLQLLRILPGQIRSLDEQCRWMKEEGANSAMTNSRICYQLHCVSKKNNIIEEVNFNKFKLNGSPCGFGGYCQDAVCVDENIPYPSDEECRQIGAIRIITSTVIECHIQCEFFDALNIVSNKTIHASNGTSCMFNGQCFNGKCITSSNEV